MSEWLEICPMVLRNLEIGNNNDKKNRIGEILIIKARLTLELKLLIKDIDRCIFCLNRFRQNMYGAKVMYIIMF